MTNCKTRLIIKTPQKKEKWKIAQKLTWSQIGHKLPLKIAKNAKLESWKNQKISPQKKKNERWPKNWFNEKVDNHIRINKTDD